MFVYVGAYTEPPVGRGEGISIFRFDPGGGDLMLSGVAAGIANPSFLVADPAGRTVYAVNELDEGYVTAFSRNSQTGELTEINRQPTHGADPCYISLDATHRFVLVANYSGENVSVFPLNGDGSLEPASCVIHHHGSSANRDRQEQPHPHMIAPTPDGRFVFATDLGADKLFVYQLDTEAGELVPNHRGPESASLPPGSGPRHFAFAPNGRTLYVLNELGSTLSVFDYDGERGEMHLRQTETSLPEDFVGENTCAHLAVPPDGRFVYGSNRGHDGIAIWKVEEATGDVTLTGHESTRGADPRNFSLDPSGTWLLAANQTSDTIVTFRRDPRSGTLEAVGELVESPSPVCVLFVPD